MAKVFGIHELHLREEVAGKERDFERFVAEEVAPAYAKSMGAEVRLLKGVRGGRIGGYTLVLEFPSVEAFTRFIPLGPGEFTEEGKRVAQSYATLMDRYNSYVKDSAWTDYVETGK